MASRVKEEEKNERIIRGLLKLTENRRCINCNSLGPQYVCTNFWTFVCTTCSGIHREFTHRVKSVSMAKFTTQEVAALQGGGNKRAREIYLTEWDSQRQSGPDGSNVERLRDFIKHVYVDRRYAGERSFGKPSSTKMGEKEDPYENSRSETYESASRSPPYEDAYERRYSEMSSPGARSDNSRNSYDDRSPGHNQESRQYNNFRRSPAHPEIVNDWRREDRFRNGWKGEDHSISDGDSKLESQSPEQPKEVSSLPVVRPVREILGDNVVPLRVIEPPKANVPKVANGSAQTQRTASSSSLGSTNENHVEVKVESVKNLIDFDADPEPLAVTQPDSLTQPASATNGNNWASFDAGPQVQVSQASNANPLESVLSQLSGSSSVPSHVPTAPGGSSGSTSSTAITLGQALAVPANGGQCPSVHQQQQQTSLFPASSGQSTHLRYTSSLGKDPSNQSQNMLVSPNVEAAFGMPYAAAVALPPVVSSPAPAVTSVGVSQAVEIKLSGRKELPEDLFTTSYSIFSASVPGWQTGPPRAPGYYSMQYPVATAIMPTFVQQSKPVNPFDVSEPTHDQVQAQAHNIPSMVSLQGALPNIPPSSGSHTSFSLRSHSPAWLPPQSSVYSSALPSHSTAYASGMPARLYMMPQLPNNTPLPGRQVMGGMGVEGTALGTLHMDQAAAKLSTAATTMQPFSSLNGNPFG